MKWATPGWLLFYGQSASVHFVLHNFPNSNGTDLLPILMYGLHSVVLTLILVGAWKT